MWPPGNSEQGNKDLNPTKATKLNSAIKKSLATESYSEPPDEKSVWLSHGFQLGNILKGTCAEL